MSAERLPERIREPKRSPSPPVTTLWSNSPVEAPGKGNPRLPPFLRPGSHRFPIQTTPPVTPEPAVIEDDEPEPTEAPTVEAEDIEPRLDSDEVYASASPDAPVEEERQDHQNPWLLLRDEIVDDEPWVPYGDEIGAIGSASQGPESEVRHPAFETDFTATNRAASSKVHLPVDQETDDNEPFAFQLADRLETLAHRLRAEGLSAIGDAIANGDRLEASLALFVAGYHAGRGE